MKAHGFSIVIASLVLLAGAANAAEGSFYSELQAVQREFDVVSFQTEGKRARRSAFATLVEHASGFSQRYPDRVEAVAWEGIILSAYAGEVSAMGAMKVARAALEALHKAEHMDAGALDGGIYASLGALYSKVPGGFIGFGDDERAAEYFAKAMEIDPDNIDSNFFYGEFLIEHGDRASAISVLNRALDAPAVIERPVFDAGRRAEIQTLLVSARE